MDTAGLASTYAATMSAQTGQALQIEMMKMASQQDASLVALLQAGAENLDAVQAAPPAGMGERVDITA